MLEVIPTLEDVLKIIESIKRKGFSSYIDYDLENNTYSILVNNHSDGCIEYLEGIFNIGSFYHPDYGVLNPYYSTIHHPNCLYFAKHDEFHNKIVSNACTIDAFLLLFEDK